MNKHDGWLRYLRDLLERGKPLGFPQRKAALEAIHGLQRALLELNSQKQEAKE